MAPTSDLLNQPSSRAQRWLFVTMVAVTLLVAFAILLTRNLYDDELGSFELILRPMADLWRKANSEDVHPPGMYALSRLGYLLTKSERWLTAIPISVFLFGLTFFLWRTRSPAWSFGSLVFFLIVGFLHPQQILWSNSVRWYPYWTGGALLILGWLLNRDSETCALRFAIGSISRAIAFGVCLAGLFYINYITLLFTVALILGQALTIAREEVKRELALWALSLTVMGLLVLPQLGPFIFTHMDNSGIQKASPVRAALALGFGVLLSDALLPWNPIDLAFSIGVVGTLVVECLRAPSRTWPLPRLDFAHGFILFFVLLAVGSGLGGKSRSFIVLCPFIAIAATDLAERMSTKNKALAVLMTCAWVCAGTYNILSRQGLVKASLGDRPEEVFQFALSKAAGKTSQFFVHDPGLTYVLNRMIRETGQPWAVCSAYEDHVHHIPAHHVAYSRPEVVFLVRSFSGSLSAKKLEAAFAQLERGIIVLGEKGVSFDRDARVKRAIPGLGGLNEGLPDFRFKISWAQLKDERPLGPVRFR